MKSRTYILENETEVMDFLRQRYPIYYLSNIFFRDIQYGIQTLLERKGMPVGYRDAEAISKAFVEQLERKKILKAIDHQSWVVMNEQFRTPVRKAAAPEKPAAPAKPAGPAPAAPRPSGGLPPLKSATPAAARPAGGLPPLKSSAPAGAAPKAAVTSSAPAQAKPAVEHKAAEAKPEQQTKEAATAEAPKNEPPKTQTPAAPPSAKTVPPAGKSALPPIKSSKPVGGG